MRNWNIISVSSPLGTKQWFWAYLWGIETWTRTVWWGWEVGVLSLPMRNWNMTKFSIYNSPKKVLSLPMRNWNSSTDRRPSAANNRFEPTYEELKLALVCQHRGFRGEFWAYLWGIETYLHQLIILQLPPVLSLPMRNWNSKLSNIYSSIAICFEPTYEELKPLSPTSNLFTGTRFEPTYEELKLFIKLKNPIYPPTFWAYLWGIETPLYNWN